MNHYVLTLEDDGAGIDLNVVRDKIVKDLNESQEKVDILSDQDLFEYLFRLGLKTKKSTLVLGGQGIWMKFIHDTILKLEEMFSYKA